MELVDYQKRFLNRKQCQWPSDVAKIRAFTSKVSTEKKFRKQNIHMA